MLVCRLALRTTQKSNETITRVSGRNRWAGLIRAAGAVHLAGCNSRYPDLWAFGAPDGPVAVPDGCGRALKRLPSWNDLRRCFRRWQKV
jgi:hypothetical protein